MEELAVKTEMEMLDSVTAFFEEALEAAGAPLKVIARINIVVDEIFSNIVRYSEASQAVAAYRINGQQIVMQFRDNGKPYDPTKAPEPDISLPAEERELGGLGIFMVTKTMDCVQYAYENGSNILTMEKSW